MKCIFILLIVLFTYPLNIYAESKKNCLSEEISSDLLKMLNNFAEIEGENPKTVGIKTKRKSCDKIIYTIGNSQWIKYRLPDEPDSWNLSSYNPGVDRKKCLKSMKAFSYSIDNRVLDRYWKMFEKEHKVFWDEDIGSVKWIDCNKPLVSSFSTFFHEEYHFLNKDRCVMLPFTNEKVCFSKSSIKNWPQYKVLALGQKDIESKIDRKNLGKIIPFEPVVQSYISVNKIYFNDIPNSSIFDLANELLAYSIGAYTNAKLLDKKISDLNNYKKATIEFLPFWIYQYKRYQIDLESKADLTVEQKINLNKILNNALIAQKIYVMSIEKLRVQAKSEFGAKKLALFDGAESVFL